LTSGCCAVSCTPAVCVWKRSISDLGFLAPNSSRITRRPDPPGGPELRDLLEQRRAAHEEEREPGPKSSTSSPALIAARTYSMPSARVNATSCTGDAPPRHVVAGDEMVFHRGSSVCSSRRCRW
jgi:hypothetical protein